VYSDVSVTHRKLTLEGLLQFHAKNPMVLFPVFALQQGLQAATLGVSTWGRLIDSTELRDAVAVYDGFREVFPPKTAAK
jgi:hypothetical protein